MRRFMPLWGFVVLVLLAGACTNATPALDPGPGAAELVVTDPAAITWGAFDEKGRAITGKCRNAFGTWSKDQTVGVVLRPLSSRQLPEAYPAVVTFPSDDWVARVRTGRNLSHDFCTDTPRFPYAEVDEEWSFVAGTVTIRLLQNGGYCQNGARLTLDGIQAESSKEALLELGARMIQNTHWQCEP